ncbi:ImmA/IrrE family metallo-endopeptidase [uncultured Cellulomonas sp.]|uniref:ImmA/IrrE family metallo-endopeptidase n=1 Tax=uncultured Cellulomonas sp. TaxID=189682 RepID=UPI00261CA069|nr:ImmA/IrrE family metallo-endopeptidase [uncultured Cellulomonas sp.]
MTRIGAAQAANNALNTLGIDQASPVDPFEAIENSGLVLGFKPMKDLLGVILPGDPGGVLINSERPASLQRYTAAHELGHWYLDQDVLRLETDDTIVGHHPHDSRELDAQTFAAHFLMPLELLYSTARRYGIRRGSEVGPEQLYQAARDMHVSYEAAVRQFVNTKLVSPGNRTELLKARPMLIKRALADGLALPDPRGDVWVLDHPDERVSVEAFVGDAIVLRLPERPSTGYRWCVEPSLDSATVHPLRPPPPSFDDGQAFGGATRTTADVITMPFTQTHSEVMTLLGDEVSRGPYEPGLTAVGGTVTRLVAYGAGAPGRESVRLSEVRPFQPEERVARLEVSALVRGTPAVEFRRRLIEEFLREEAAVSEWDD